MRYYLIENLMGFENPVEIGEREELELMKERYEKKPATQEAGSDAHRFEVEATYYIVPKDEWDSQHCPLIPVDLS